jgi:hypothetical protein
MLKRMQSQSGAKRVGFPTGNVLSATPTEIRLKAPDIEYCETAKTLAKPDRRNTSFNGN